MAPRVVMSIVVGWLPVLCGAADSCVSASSLKQKRTELKPAQDPSSLLTAQEWQQPEEDWPWPGDEDWDWWHPEGECERNPCSWSKWVTTKTEYTNFESHRMSYKLTSGEFESNKTDVKVNVIGACGRWLVTKVTEFNEKTEDCQPTPGYPVWKRGDAGQSSLTQKRTELKPAQDLMRPEGEDPMPAEGECENENTGCSWSKWVPTQRQYFVFKSYNMSYKLTSGELDHKIKAHVNVFGACGRWLVANVTEFNEKTEYCQPTPGYPVWKRGDAGQSCDATCELIARKCNSELQSQLTTEKLLAAAFDEAGYACKSFLGARDYHGAPFSTGRSAGDCAPFLGGSKTSSCSWNAKSTHFALCACV